LEQLGAFRDYLTSVGHGAGECDHGVICDQHGYLGWEPERLVDGHGCKWLANCEHYPGNCRGNLFPASQPRKLRCERERDLHGHIVEVSGIDWSSGDAEPNRPLRADRTSVSDRGGERDDRVVHDQHWSLDCGSERLSDGCSWRRLAERNYQPDRCNGNSIVCSSRYGNQGELEIGVWKRWL